MHSICVSTVSFDRDYLSSARLMVATAPMQPPLQDRVRGGLVVRTGGSWKQVAQRVSRSLTWPRRQLWLGLWFALGLGS